jgi:hypothetical protein
MQEKSLGEVELGTMDKLKRAVFPIVPSPLALLGPGVILASFNLGSGEVIWWPYLAAKYGLAFVCYMIPFGLMQWWINTELARYSLVTGEPTWAAFRRISRMFSIIYFIMAVITLLWWGGYASAGGTALAAITNFPVGWDARGQTLFWSYVTMIIFFLALVLSPVIYKFLERFLLVCMIIGVGGVIVVAFHPHLWGVWPTFAQALVTYQAWPANFDPKDYDVLLTSLAYLGLGGFWQLTYPNWIREAGTGMAKLIGRVTSPITGKPEPIGVVGLAPECSEENKKRYHGWLKTVYVNNTWGVVINLFTTILMAFLAYAILHPKGIYPSGYRLVVEQGRFLGEFWPPGYTVFLFVCAFLMVDTYAVILDFVPRLYTDFLHTTFPTTRRKSYRWWYYLFVCIFFVWTSISILLAAPGPLIIWGGVLNFLSFPIMHFAMLYMNYYKMPKYICPFLKPKWYWLILGLIISVIYTAICIWYLSIVLPPLLKF